MPKATCLLSGIELYSIFSNNNVHADHRHLVMIVKEACAQVH